MDEITTWFLEEFGHLGFEVTPTMYDPVNFTPVRGVLWRGPNGAYIKTNIGITTDLSNDLIYGMLDPVLEYKSLVRDSVNSFLESKGYAKDFKPRKKINKIKL